MCVSQWWVIALLYVTITPTVCHYYSHCVWVCGALLHHCVSLYPCLPSTVCHCYPLLCVIITPIVCHCYPPLCVIITPIVCHCYPPLCATVTLYYVSPLFHTVCHYYPHCVSLLPCFTLHCEWVSTLLLHRSLTSHEIWNCHIMKTLLTHSIFYALLQSCNKRVNVQTIGMGHVPTHKIWLTWHIASCNLYWVGNWSINSFEGYSHFLF